MTIEDLKKHCIKTIKMSEAIESIPNVRVTDSRSLQEHKMVLKLIEAWEKVKEEVNKQIERDYVFAKQEYAYIKVHEGTANGLEVALDIIDKHLSEVSE